MKPVLTRDRVRSLLGSFAGKRILVLGVFDVTGAGDTVLATLAVARAGGAEMEEAVMLANHAAGIAIRKVGTATVSQSELLADFHSRNADSTS